MTLLSIVRGACARLNLPRPSVVYTSTDASVIQILELAQQHGKELARRAAWKALTAEKTFTTTAAAAQVSSLADDLDWIIPETMFNRSTNRRVIGPMTPDEWQMIQSSLTSRVDPAFRIRGTSLLFSPTPSAGQTVGYEYVTKNWCQSSGGTAQASWAADADTPLLDEQLHISGLVWRFRQAKGLDFEADLQIHEAQVGQAILREGVRPRISTDGYEYAGRRSADSIAGERPNTIVTDNYDGIGWD
jgi:hypothetical protein